MQNGNPEVAVFYVFSLSLWERAGVRASARTRHHLRVFQHFADNLYRFFLNLLAVLSARKLSQ